MAEFVLTEGEVSKVIAQEREPTASDEPVQKAPVGIDIIKWATKGDITALDTIFNQDMQGRIYNTIYFLLVDRQSAVKGAPLDSRDTGRDLTGEFTEAVLFELGSRFMSGHYKFEMPLDAWIFGFVLRFTNENKNHFMEAPARENILDGLKKNERTIQILENAAGLNHFQVARIMRKPYSWVYKHWLEGNKQIIEALQRKDTVA